MVAARLSPPTPEEWKTNEIPNDRKLYLDAEFSFEAITSRIFAEAIIQPSRIEPIRHTRDKSAKSARQIIFPIKVNSESFDLFYNARDGLRGRYWQSPDIGFLATKQFIEILLPRLLDSAARTAPINPTNAASLNTNDIQAALTATSAKVWPCEFNTDGERDLKYDGKPQIDVDRWRTAETSGGSPLWRWTPHDRVLEIKSALLDLDGREHIPEGKRTRSCQIHQFGFT